MTQQQTPPPALTELKLTPEIKDAVNGSFMGGNPVIVAYVNEQGQPSVSFRGSAQAYSDHQLAVWVRNPDGGILKGVNKNPNITIMYRNPNPEARAIITFKGKGRIDESADARKAVYDNSPEPERNADREQKGKALIIDLESVDGFMPGARLQMRK